MKRAAKRSRPSSCKAAPILLLVPILALAGCAWPCRPTASFRPSTTSAVAVRAGTVELESVGLRCEWAL